MEPPIAGQTERRAALEELHAAFDRELTTDKRAAAETAYALAFRYRNADIDGCRRFDIAKAWATRAIELLDALPSDTVKQVASTRPAVAGIPMPDLLHSDVVRGRLGDILN